MESTQPINWHDIFLKIDADGDGLILRSELRHYLLHSPVSRIPLDENLVDNLLARVDFDGDGYINLQEFYALVNVSHGPVARAVRRALVSAALGFTPHSQQSHADRIYLTHYNCCPPPLAVPLLLLAQVGVFVYTMVLYPTSHPYSPVSYDSPLIFDPHRRAEAWRFISYMFLHAGYVHLISNSVMTLLVGLPLEMVHKWYRILPLYLAGVVGGSLAASIVDPTAYLVGASGGVYALIAAHMANIILNWSEMPFNWARLLVLLTLLASDTGVFIYATFISDDAAGNRVSYVAHVAGFVSGLLVGLVVLRNLRRLTWETALKWTGLVIYVLVVCAGVLVNVMYWQEAGMYPPMPVE